MSDVIHKDLKLKCFRLTLQTPLQLLFAFANVTKKIGIFSVKRCIVVVELCQNQMLFVGVTQMYTNKEVYSCNAILVTKIFCYRYLTVNNFAKNNVCQRNLMIF